MEGELGDIYSTKDFFFIACFKSRFASTVIAEMRGINHNGVSPFWEAIGRPFFQMDFKHADFINATQGGQFISDLMPKYPIYVNLLATQAQEVIGRPYDASKPAMQLLEQEGFRHQGYVDVFDAGPTMQGEREHLRTVRESKRGVLVGTKPLSGANNMLVATTGLADFRVGFTVAEEVEGGLILTPDAAGLLDLKQGDAVRFVAR